MGDADELWNAIPGKSKVDDLWDAIPSKSVSRETIPGIGPTPTLEQFRTSSTNPM